MSDTTSPSDLRRRSAAAVPSHPSQHPTSTSPSMVLETANYEPPLPNRATGEFNIHPSLPEHTSSSYFVGTDTPGVPPRWYLRAQAIMWRFLMAIGMFLHRLAPPRPKKYAFVRSIPTTVSPTHGSVNLYFYVPKNYNTTRMLNKDGSRYPVVINFHGGGFTIGHPLDDAKWASTVVDECNAVVVCVEYRLAPEHPFPTAVEDGVDAMLYVVKNAAPLHIDPARIALSGFSCGGNLAFTVPMRLHEELDPRAGRDTPAQAASLFEDAEARLAEMESEGSSSSKAGGTVSSPVHPTKAVPAATTTTHELSDSVDSSTISPEIAHAIKPCALVSWYPSADYTLTRGQRRETLLRADMELSPLFTALFDSSYISPADLNKSNPFLSPGRAPEALLRDGLPDDIIMFMCEWDVLRAEAQHLRDRLQEMGKRVTSTTVEGQPHGWDKSPNPLREAPGVREHYKTACRELRRVFYGAEEAADKRRSFGIGRFSIGGRSKRDNMATR